jgi:hypothetical protein
MTIRFSSLNMDWWTQAIFWLDVVVGTEFFSTSFFLAALGLGAGIWITKWILT